MRLDIDLELARQVCANLVGLDPADLSPQDISDAAGELANMTGGSVKTLCAPTSRLSLPSVAMGRDFRIHRLAGDRDPGNLFFASLRRADRQRDPEGSAGIRTDASVTAMPVLLKSTLSKPDR